MIREKAGRRARRASPLRNRILGTLLAAALPFIGLLLLYNYYFLEAYYEEFAETGEQSVELYAQRIGKDLEAVGTLLFNLTFSDANYQRLTTRATELDAHLAAQNITAQYRTMVNAYRGTGAFFLRSEPNAIHRDIFAEGYDYAVASEIRAYVRSLASVEGGRTPPGWFLAEVGGRCYLFRIMGADGTYVAAMVDFERVLEHDPPPGDIHGLFATGETALSDREDLAEYGIVLRATDHETYRTGAHDQFIVVSAALGHGGVDLVFIMEQPGFFSQMQGLQAAMIALSLAALIGLLVAYAWIKRSVLSPLQRLVTQMVYGDEPPDGQTPQRQFNIVEFDQVKSRMDELKLQAYEQEIQKQKAELQYLQLQVEPHFFLGCLKSLYGMAQQERYRQIQEMILAISAHLRYTFRDNRQLVPLGDEIRHVENYIRIQRMAMRIPPDCICTLPDELREVPVPPLSIQTFVENSVKHGARWDKALTVWVKAALLETEDGRYVDITVADNGTGFDPDALELLNRPGPGELYGDKHVGIRNVANRLALLYENRATVAFFNSGEGAVSEMILPMADAPGHDRPQQEQAVNTP